MTFFDDIVDKLLTSVWFNSISCHSQDASPIYIDIEREVYALMNSVSPDMEARRSAIEW